MTDIDMIKKSGWRYRLGDAISKFGNWVGGIPKTNIRINDCTFLTRTGQPLWWYDAKGEFNLSLLNYVCVPREDCDFDLLGIQVTNAVRETVH